MGFVIKTRSKIPKLKREFKRTQKILEMGARVVVKDAKKNVAVKTGKLKSSIGFKVVRKDEDGQVNIFARRDYALKQEEHKPFIGPAVESNARRIQKEYARAIRKKIKKGRVF